MDESVVKEQVLLVSVDTGDFDAETSLEELRLLVETAGGEVFATITQKRERPDNACFLGAGRLEEARLIAQCNNLDLIICDAELSPVQQRNMENATETRVIDRTMLILDIFAGNARTAEGKLQVELAQLKYSLPRLSGRGTQLSRLGGGIGTRGPGESKLESDRRHIRRRIHALEESLASLEKRRELHRKRRKKDGVVTCAIVGYTNAGKSTLLNALTDAGVLAENKLFATLDPTSRALKLPDGREIMLIDTVGFISRLPTKLVEAFKSTLEEAADADLILNLCDASDPEYENHLAVTRSILQELGAGDKPTVTVYNKCDAMETPWLLPVSRDAVMISALSGRGFDQLMDALMEALPPTRRRVLLLMPYTQGSLTDRVRREGAVSVEEYRADGVFMDAVVGVELLPKLLDYVLPEEDA
ncbi:MAG: GTPase HflX [Ruminococcaceae bacterium]|nr:GTPase HflX [Oscillospiraceae bacterium]